MGQHARAPTSQVRVHRTGRGRNHSARPERHEAAAERQLKVDRTITMGKAPLGPMLRPSPEPCGRTHGCGRPAARRPLWDRTLTHRRCASRVASRRGATPHGGPLSPAGSCLACDIVARRPLASRRDRPPRARVRPARARRPVAAPRVARPDERAPRPRLVRPRAGRARGARPARRAGDDGPAGGARGGARVRLRDRRRAPALPPPPRAALRRHARSGCGAAAASRGVPEDMLPDGRESRVRRRRSPRRCGLTARTGAAHEPLLERRKPERDPELRRASARIGSAGSGPGAARSVRGGGIAEPRRDPLHHLAPPGRARVAAVKDRPRGGRARARRGRTRPRRRGGRSSSRRRRRGRARGRPRGPARRSRSAPGRRVRRGGGRPRASPLAAASRTSASASTSTAAVALAGPAASPRPRPTRRAGRRRRWSRCRRARAESRAAAARSARFAST